ncbi:hypothetical protein GBAR_LOCUS25278 [Geodia barretti]|uniref:DEAD/DEAH-box helicase domain-containing protein n=1 Tax=Geodia barretti TaxID=519541 RepID=A0AA35TDZ2_GEOBA|nr:hypothetical protein GBAR_LOCUS25278 [Geodia barretti]
MNIHDEINNPRPGGPPRRGARLAGRQPGLARGEAQTGGGQLFLHQATGLELLGYGHNLVISTGTASGKSLALARDQVIRWRNMAEAAGLDPAAINRIDGDVRDLTERRQILQRTRLALMTPDVIQQWLMAYSEPLYDKRPLRHDLREVQNTQYNVRRFLSNLAYLILDEAHTYGRSAGTHCSTWCSGCSRTRGS